MSTNLKSELYIPAFEKNEASKPQLYTSIDIHPVVSTGQQNILLSTFLRSRIEWVLNFNQKPKICGLKFFLSKINETLTELHIHSSLTCHIIQTLFCGRGKNTNATIDQANGSP